MSAGVAMVTAAGSGGGGLGVGAVLGLFVGIPVAVFAVVVAAVYLPDRLRARAGRRTPRTLPVLGTPPPPAAEPSTRPANRARSFGAVATDYDRARPAPPPQALDWAVPADCAVAVDLAAGTGKTSRGLVNRATRVFAVEPDDRMRAVLHSRSPEIIAVAGTAEAIPLATGVADAVLVSSAWHWFDHDVACPEMARVLRSGGTLTVLRCGVDRREPWLAELAALRAAHRAATPDAPQPPNGADPARPANSTDSTDHTGPAGESHRGGHRRTGRPPALPPNLPFTPWEHEEFHWDCRMAPEDLVMLIGTYSGVLSAPPWRRAAIAARAAELVEQHAEPDENGEIAVPFRASCWRSRRD